MNKRAIFTFMVSVFFSLPRGARGNDIPHDLDFQNFEPPSAAARRGLEHLYAGKILAVKGGIPLSLLRRAEHLPSGKELIANLQDPTHQWQLYGYPPSPPDRDLGLIEPGKSLPTALSAHGDPHARPVVTNNCLVCHTSMIAGQVIAGAPNNQAYFPPMIADLAKARRMRTMLNLNPIWFFGTTGAEKSSLNIAIDYFDLVLSPMLTRQKTRGAVTGPASVLTYLTRMTTNMAATGLADSLRYDTRKIIASDLRQAPDVAPPTRPHPWWVIKYKSTLYRYPEKKDLNPEVTAQNFMDRHIGVSTTLAPHHRPIVEDVLQFATEMRAPQYPRSLDAAKVAEGERIFHERKIAALGGATCVSCHGSYHRQNGVLHVDYPSRYVNVGTDPSVFEAGRYYMNLVKLRVPAHELAAFSDYPQERGYLAPPLVGVWASPPYFHNGSVPTLYAVLKSSTRPRAWARSLDPAAYDEREGGMAVVPLEEVSAPGQIYDTTLAGYHNGGHSFVDSWDDATIYALVEFLKTLND